MTKNLEFTGTSCSPGGKAADAVEADADYLAQLEALDTGHPVRDVRNLDIPRTAACYRYFGGIADKVEGAVIPVLGRTCRLVAAADVHGILRVDCLEALFELPTMLFGQRPASRHREPAREGGVDLRGPESDPCGTPANM